MTLNWAMQVSTAPKLVAVAVERHAQTHELLSEGDGFSVALLDREDRAVVRRFVKPAAHDPAERTLGGLGYFEAATGAPIPDLALAWVDCARRETVPLGSHTLFVGEVVDAGARPGGDEVEVLRMEDTRMSYGG